MQLEINGRDLVVTEALKAQAQKKLATLDKQCENATAKLLLYVEKDGQCAELTVYLAGKSLRAEAKAADMYEAFDLLVDKMKRQLVKYREQR